MTHHFALQVFALGFLSGFGTCLLFSLRHPRRRKPDYAKRSFVAKRGGKCFLCEHHVKKGARAAMTRDRKFIHKECSP